jgi:hypothetical protein
VTPGAARGPSLLSVKPEARLRRIVPELLKEACGRLGPPATAVTSDENELTRMLYRLLLDANMARWRSGREHLESAPVFDGQQSPVPPVAGTPAQAKKPDLQYTLCDHAAGPAQAVRCFAVECKRLGFGNAGLTGLYVTHGLSRFVSPTHQYGLNMAVGAMVGYVRGTTAAAAARLVDSRIVKAGHPPLAPAAAVPPLVVQSHGAVCPRRRHRRRGPSRWWPLR